MSIAMISGTIGVTVDAVDVEQIGIAKPDLKPGGARIVAAALDKEDVKSFQAQLSKGGRFLEPDRVCQSGDDWLVTFEIRYEGVITRELLNAI